MTRDEMLERMPSTELTGWMALMKVHHEEAEERQHIAESGDGIVIVSGRDEEFDDEDDEDEPDAETE